MLQGEPATYVRLAQLDRAFGYGPKGRGFESSNARYFVRLRTLVFGVAGKPLKWAFPPFLFCHFYEKCNNFLVTLCKVIP